MTKQSMAELVAHLERHGYVERHPTPAIAARSSSAPRRAQRRPCDRPHTMAEVEARWAERQGEARIGQLRKLLEELNAAL